MEWLIKYRTIPHNSKLLISADTKPNSKAKGSQPFNKSNHHKIMNGMEMKPADVRPADKVARNTSHQTKMD